MSECVTYSRKCSSWQQVLSYKYQYQHQYQRSKYQSSTSTSVRKEIKYQCHYPVQQDVLSISNAELCVCKVDLV